MEFVDLGSEAELRLVGQKACQHGSTRVLLCVNGQTVHAVENLCPHARQPLLGGQVLPAGTIVCAKHGAKFDLSTGLPANGVTRLPLRVFPVRLCEGRVEVGLE